MNFDFEGLVNMCERNFPCSDWQAVLCTHFTCDIHPFDGFLHIRAEHAGFFTECFHFLGGGVHVAVHAFAEFQNFPCGRSVYVAEQGCFDRVRVWCDVKAGAVMFRYEVREQVSVGILGWSTDTKIRLLFEVISIEVLSHIVANNQGG